MTGKSGRGGRPLVAPWSGTQRNHLPLAEMNVFFKNNLLQEI